jgi:hypothetical protein
MARTVEDEEIAHIIAQRDSDWPSETDDSLESSSKSDSSVPAQNPQVAV